MWNFATVWAAAICAIVLFEVKKASPWKRENQMISSLKAQGKRLLFFQLYPRKLWIWWCGGLNVLDMTLVLTWLAFNLMWAYFTVQPKYVSIRAQIHQEKVTPRAGHLNMLNQTASCIGTATMFSTALLFFPVPRNSFLHYIFNTDFSGMLKYHRWLGYGTGWTAIIHGLVYWVYWAIKGGFYESWKKWGDDHSNNLAGFIAMVFMLLIMVTSMHWVRRYYFQVFIRCHIIGFVGFTVFTYIHYWQRWWYQTPGLVLLALDWTFRLAQWLHPSWVTGQFVTADKSIITIHLKWKKSAQPRPGDFMFLNIPAGRRFQWHPVSVAHVEETEAGAVLVTAHMKCYGKWTTVMVAQMLEKGKVLMRVDGPYGRPYGPGWQSHDAVVIFAGGIGATPMLGMLRDIAVQRMRAAELGAKLDFDSLPFPKKVHLYWACRGMAEFSLLDNDLLHAVREGWLEVQLFCTRPGHAASSIIGDGESEKLVNGSSLYPKHSMRQIQLPTKALVSIGHSQSVASPYFFKPGLLEAYGAGFYWAAACTLAFLGAFFGLLMSAAFDSNLAMTGGMAKANYKTALIAVIATFVGAMGLPALVIFPLNIRRHKKYQSAFVDKTLSDFPLENVGQEITVQDHKVGSLEDGTQLQIESGRPGIAAILAEIAARYSSRPSVAVFAAGPRSMTAEVKLACVEQNDTWRRPYCDFSNHAFDL